MSDQVKIKTGVDASGVKSGLDKIKNQFAMLGSSLAGGILGIFAFNKAIEKAVEVAELARKFGTTAEDVQKLGAVAKRVGSDMETVAKGGFKAFIEAQKALTGEAGAIKHFEELGITAKKLSTLKGPADTLLLLAHAVSTAKDKNLALAASAEVVGIKQASLIQMLKMGDQQIREIGNGANIMSNETVEALEKGSKAVDRFKNQFTILAGTLLGELKPQIVWLIEALERVTMMVKQGFQQIGQFKKGGFNGAADLQEEQKVEFRALLVKQKKQRIDDMTPAEIKALDNAQSDPEVRLYARYRLKHPNKDEATGDTEALKDTTSAKHAQIIADSLTKAGGGGIAFLSPDLEPAKKSAEYLLSLKESSARQEQTLKNIEAKTGWQ